VLALNMVTNSSKITRWPFPGHNSRERKKMWCLLGKQVRARQDVHEEKRIRQLEEPRVK